MLWERPTHSQTQTKTDIDTDSDRDTLETHIRTFTRSALNLLASARNPRHASTSGSLATPENHVDARSQRNNPGESSRPKLSRTHLPPRTNMTAPCRKRPCVWANARGGGNASLGRDRGCGGRPRRLLRNPGADGCSRPRDDSWAMRETLGVLLLLALLWPESAAEMRPKSGGLRSGRRPHQIFEAAQSATHNVLGSVGVSGLGIVSESRRRVSPAAGQRITLKRQGLRATKPECPG